MIDGDCTERTYYRFDPEEWPTSPTSGCPSDAYSCLVIGWSLDWTLKAKLAVGALQMAINKRGTPAGLIYHSDRGVQCACGDYTKLLANHKIQIGMIAKPNAYDNAMVGSSIETLKHEEIYRVEYRDRTDARRGIYHFLERTYNRNRLHSALGYKTPVIQSPSITGGSTGTYNIYKEIGLTELPAGSYVFMDSAYNHIGKKSGDNP